MYALSYFQSTNGVIATQACSTTVHHMLNLMSCHEAIGGLAIT